MTPRIDPRRPSIATAAGLRRIVLGSDLGDRGAAAGGHDAPAQQPLRSGGPLQGCVLAVVQPDRGALDDHARETIAAAALLARPHECVHLIVLGPCTEAWATLGVDQAELLSTAAGADPHALAQWLDARRQALGARHLLLPDRGTEADLGRRMGAWLPAASQVVELTIADTGDCRARVRLSASQDAVAPCPPVVLLARSVAVAALPFVGRGASATVDPGLPEPAPGVVELGIEAGDPQTVSLEEADFILAAGNGVTDVPLFNTLARALGAATCASRVAVDDGRFPRDKQVGATGRVVQARAYVAIGISGAIQHLQGIRDCRHVIAVNTDAAAPITQRAELTVVAEAQALMRSLLRQLPPPMPEATP